MVHPQGMTKNDPGRREGWEERTLEALRERRPSESNTNNQYGFPMSWKFRLMLKRAAEQRGISMSGYVRRALAVFIARDLGVDYVELCGLNKKPLGFGQTARRRESEQDDGEGFGHWI